MADLRIPEEKASEVFELAGRLYARQNPSYWLENRGKAGSSVDIPPEFIQKALSQLQAREEEALELARRAQQYQKGMRIGGSLVGLAFVGWVSLTCSGLTSAAHRADQAWTQVESALWQQSELMPELIKAAPPKSELNTLLTQAQHTYGAATTPAEKVAAATAMRQSVGQVQAALSSSPRSQNDPLKTLQDDLASAESQVLLALGRYNLAVAHYNQQVQTFPLSLLANLLGFEPKPLLLGAGPTDSQGL